MGETSTAERVRNRTITVDTSVVPVRERVDYWHDVVSSCILPLEFRLISERPFNGSLKSLHLGDVGVSLVEATAHCAVRTAPMIRRAGADHVVVNFLLTSGCEAVQDGRTALAAPGSAVFCNGARQYTLNFREDFRIAVITVPHELLRRGVACPDRAVARDLGQISELCPVARSYVERVLADPPQLHSETAARLGRNLAELISMMIGEAVQQSPMPLSENRTAALARLYAYVDANLSEPDLSVQAVSKALRLSPRNINRLLETEETSLNRLIWSMRLKRVSIDLRDPALSGWSISQIAFACGFNDLTHFSKSFRQKFHLAPRDYRRLHLPRT